MKLSKRLISIILALLLLLGMSCIAAYAAEGGDQSAGGGDQSAAGGSDQSAGGGDQSAGGSDQGAGGSDQSYSGGGDQGYSGDPNSGYTDPYYNPGYVENNYEEDPIYWGAGSDDTVPDQGSAGSVSDKTTLYDTSDVDSKDLEENQWSDIELNESKAAASRTSDFTKMQTDTTTEDNGQWMLYVGLGLIGLSFLGIVYFIVATVQAKKRNDRRSSADRERMENPRSYSHSSHQPARSSQHTSSRGHYSDGYSTTRRKTSSRSDTDEVYLPRRVK